MRNLITMLVIFACSMAFADELVIDQDLRKKEQNNEAKAEDTLWVPVDPQPAKPETLKLEPVVEKKKPEPVKRHPVPRLKRTHQPVKIDTKHAKINVVKTADGREVISVITRFGTITITKPQW